MQANLVFRTSIVWMMMKEEFLQEEDEASMMKILADHEPRAGPREDGPFGSKNGDAAICQPDTFVVSALDTQNISAPQMDLSVYLEGHGGRYGPPKSRVLLPNLDFLSKKTVPYAKLKGKQIVDNTCQF